MSEQEETQELEQLDIAALRQELLNSRSESLTKLKTAHSNLVKAINQNINDRIRSQLEKQPKSTFVTVIEPEKGADLLGIKLEVLLDGYYNKEKDEYSRRKHEKAGIETDPLTQLEDFYSQKNDKFNIEDISDSSKSDRWVIKVNF
jgi:hypothetical protein